MIPGNLKSFLIAEGVMAEPEPTQGPAFPALPSQAGALYSPANPDGVRSGCGNCVHYAYGERSCYLHDPDLAITPSMWCGHHVFSRRPMQAFAQRLPMQVLLPTFSGLVTVPGGVSCDHCCHYQGFVGDSPAGMQLTGTGVCLALVNENGQPVTVEALASCARFEAIS